MKIRLINENDAELLSAYYLLNSDFFKPWEPKKTEGYHQLET